MSVVIETTLGDITVDLYLNERPRACLNFLKLCKIKYYNFNLFHTISRGFIAQTGDPTGSRTGGECIFGVIEGPSKRFFEAENEPRIKHTRPGLLSFVGGEDNLISSQFFLTLGEDLTYLDKKHCVFGEVVEGFDILEVVNEVICDNDDRPYQDVRITHTVVLDDPFPDPRGLRVPSKSPSPSPKRLAGGRIAPDEQIDETSGKSYQEIAELQAEREAKARATILEMVGDIPDAEMAPPENVLFVCKLNPVTTDDDLEIIFSRFGNIKSCEVIRDRKTGDSLQYAFIEFEEQKACEDAYFKMGNVLIDDRRIHVDFSQSVSKVKWLGKGRGVAHYDEKGNKKQADANNGIGKGDYKTRNGNGDSYNDKKKEYRQRSRSPVRGSRLNNGSTRRRYSRSPRREKWRSRSPRRNRRQSASSDRHSLERYNRSRRQSKSPLYNRRHNRSPAQFSRRNPYRRRSKSPRRSYNRNYRSHSNSRRKSSPRKKSRSPVINSISHVYLEKSISPTRSRRERLKSKENSKYINRESTPRKIENKENRKNSKSPANRKYGARSPSTSKSIRKSAISPKHINSLSSISSFSKIEESKSDSPVRQKRQSENDDIQKKVSEKKRESSKKKLTSKTKRKKYHTKTFSDTSDIESEQGESKKKKSKKKVSSSSETSSSEEDSSSSSEEEKVKIKSKKRKSKKNKVKKNKKHKKKYSSSESSSSESESGSTESSSSSSNSESDDSPKSKKKKSKRKRTSSSSESD